MDRGSVAMLRLKIVPIVVSLAVDASDAGAHQKDVKDLTNKPRSSALLPHQ